MMTMVNLFFVTQDSWTIVFLSLLHCRRSCYKLFFRKEFLKEKLRNNFYKEFLKGQHCVTTFMRKIHHFIDITTFHYSQTKKIQKSSFVFQLYFARKDSS
mgnify:CR=1 FL=1